MVGLKAAVNDRKSLQLLSLRSKGTCGFVFSVVREAASRYNMLSLDLCRIEPFSDTCGWGIPAILDLFEMKGHPL